MQVGIEEIKNAAPQTSEEQHQLFLLKKRIVNSLVSRVKIDKERNLEVTIRLDLFDLENNDSDGGDSTEVQAAVQVSKDGIYTRRFGLYRAGMIVVTI